MAVATENVSLVVQPGPGAGLAAEPGAGCGSGPPTGREPVSIDPWAALLALVEQLLDAKQLDRACLLAADRLRELLSCAQAAIGLTARSGCRCRLRAVSGLSRFDRHSELAAALEAALTEVLVLGGSACWPAPEGATPPLAHRRLCVLSGSPAALGLALPDGAGAARGALLLLGPVEVIERARASRWPGRAAQAIGRCLGLLSGAEPGWVRKTTRRLQALLPGRGRTAALIAALILAALLATPMPYRIGCDCELEPVRRRFVAAPFDGTLAKTLVEPGDVVTAGTVLARMDGREIRWKLAGLMADYHRATKQREAHLAAHQVADAQLAGLEAERLRHRIELLQYRADNLEIKSPIDGLVITGDLRKAEGVPLTVGQKLFEVAPLQPMVVQVAVPQREIGHVRPGMPVRIWLQACPGRQWQGTIRRIHPRAELREHQTVFIAEVTLPNEEATLRPGMKGTAKIVGRRHPLAWNLFHRPWEALVLRFGW